MTMRRKLFIGALVAIGWVVAPVAAGSGGSTQALTCPGALDTGCGTVQLVVDTVCAGAPISTPTVAFVTVSIDRPPTIDCPI